MKDLTANTNGPSTARIGRPARMIAAPPAQLRRGKARKTATGPIKRLITVAALATTVGGGALLAQHDATRAAQAADAAPTDLALIAEVATPTSMLKATATPPLLATATLTQVTLTTAQTIATLQPAPQTTDAPATTVPATATPLPATTVRATATVAKATAIPVGKAVARTKSSR